MQLNPCAGKEKKNRLPIQFGRMELKDEQSHILIVQYSPATTPAHHKNEETFTALRTVEESPLLNL